MLSAGRRPARGVSLIEVAITLTLLALLVFAVMPDVVAMVANGRIRSSAESYMQGLQRARNEALRTNQPVSFWLASVNGSGELDDTCALSSTSRGWVVSLNDPAGKCATATSTSVDPMIAERAVAGSTAGNVSVTGLQSNGTAATSVTFDGFGRVTAATALWRINLDHVNSGNNYRPLRIQIARGGSVRLCEPRVTDTNDPRICQ